MAPAEEAAARPASIEEYLALAEEQDLVRLATAGSVDDGKSTLIGRLLYDSKGMFDDQLAAIRSSKVNRAAGPLDFSLLTDGLRAEREQGITIDVAYRHFSTPRRKFIIADTPGHEQYTRNMATGASTADVAVILVDARNGVLPQSRRHAYIANLLGIPQLAVAVNKMDLVGWRQEVFAGVRDEFAGYLRRIDAPRGHLHSRQRAPRRQRRLRRPRLPLVRRRRLCSSTWKRFPPPRACKNANSASRCNG